MYYLFNHSRNKKAELSQRLPRDARYMGALKIFGNPRLLSPLLLFFLFCTLLYFKIILLSYSAIQPQVC